MPMMVRTQMHIFHEIMATRHMPTHLANEVFKVVKDQDPKTALSEYIKHPAHWGWTTAGVNSLDNGLKVVGMN